MNKLLNANFFELIKSKFFACTLLICAAIGVLLTILIYYNPTFNFPEGMDIVIDPADAVSIVPSMATMIIPFAASSTVALLLDSQYNHGTIRNKVISGHSRIKIFLSGLIVSCVASVLYFVVYQVGVFSVATLALGYDKFELKPALVSLATMLVMTTSIGTVLSFIIGNMLRGGKMIVTILAVQYALNLSLVLSMFKDNKVVEFLLKVFPQSNMFKFSYVAIPENIEQNVIISLVLIVAMVIFGSFSFNKCDIK